MFSYCMKVLLLVIATLVANSAALCELSEDLQKEIQSYQSVVNQIITAAKNGSYSGELYNDLADFLDEFGPRKQGTDILENSIDNVIERQKAAGLTVSTLPVPIPNWIRGEETAEMLTPRRQKISILGLGYSNGTSAEGVTAPVIVVNDFDELEQRKNEVAGKIVLFNAKFLSYGQTVAYRNNGPNAASKLKAVAALVRSITGTSLYTPHTGSTTFDDPSLRIPAAAITLEDAEMIARLASKGVEVTINIKSTSRNGDERESRNVIGDIVGATKPDEYVIISGHIDSWDVGQGAQDDGGGAFLAWHSLRLIKTLGLKTPARTIRSILWTAEEGGLIGSAEYLDKRRDEIPKWVAAFESDSGIFNTIGVGFAGNDEAACIMQEILSLLKSINGSTLSRQTSAGSDIGDFSEFNIPLGEPFSPNTNYFYYHHAPSDYVTAIKSEDLDQHVAIFASVVYVLADLSVRLPRDPVLPSASRP